MGKGELLINKKYWLYLIIILIIVFPVNAGTAEGKVPLATADYRTFQDYQEELHEMESLYPEMAKLHEIGESVEGRPIYALEISMDPGNKDGRPESVHSAMHHAREWPSGEIAMDMAWYLLENYKHDEQITSIVNDIRTWIIPMVNPDGFIYSQNEYEMWRKNRRDTGDGTYGIDLNRNYSYYWGGEGSSGNPGSDTYRGPEPFSEPETRAIRDFYLDRHVITSVTGHTYGRLILYPWGYKEELIDDPLPALMAREMAEWNDYKDGPTKTTIYQVSGDKNDWVYGKLRGIIFCFEYGDSFIPPYEDSYHQIWEKNLPALLHCIEKARDYSGIIKGSVTDKITGEKIEAKLKMELEVKAPLAGSRSGERITGKQKTFINVYGNYEWHVLPGNQPEINNEPYYITASSPGRETKTVELSVNDFEEELVLHIELKPEVMMDVDHSGQYEDWMWDIFHICKKKMYYLNLLQRLK